jgi:hypothetical protein
MLVKKHSCGSMGFSFGSSLGSLVPIGTYWYQQPATVWYYSVPTVKGDVDDDGIGVGN